jgi:hypothetical protein
MKQFGPIDEYPAKDAVELYLITCIRYYQYLCKRYGYENGATIYNAGEAQYAGRSIPTSTRYYVSRVNKYITDYINELHAIARKNVRLRDQEERRLEWERERAEALLRQQLVEHRISIRDYLRAYQKNRFVIHNTIECIVKKRKEWYDYRRSSLRLSLKSGLRSRSPGADRQRIVHFPRLKADI